MRTTAPGRAAADDTRPGERASGRMDATGPHRGRSIHVHSAHAARASSSCPAQDEPANTAGLDVLASLLARAAAGDRAAYFDVGRLVAVERRAGRTLVALGEALGVDPSCLADCSRLASAWRREDATGVLASLGLARTLALGASEMCPTHPPTVGCEATWTTNPEPRLVIFTSDPDAPSVTSASRSRRNRLLARSPGPARPGPALCRARSGGTEMQARMSPLPLQADGRGGSSGRSAVGQPEVG